MELTELSQKILKKLPAAIIPNAADSQLIKQHKAFFAKHENDLVSGFYDVVFGDSNVKNYLSADERQQREQTLRQWYQVTTLGNFDEQYWNWQAFVGVVHVKHGIPNSAMLGMWGWMLSFLQEKAFAELPMDEAMGIMSVMHKLQAVVSSLVVEGFILTEREAIKRASGLNEAILGRFIHIEIDRLLKQGRGALQQSAAHASAA